MISVCMATYNGAKYLREQIDSIICQLGENDELIISDDGSTDDTIAIIESYCDKRIKLFHHKKKNNTKKLTEIISYNFENALNKAGGDYIFLSDQDDIWLPNKLNEGIKSLEFADLALLNCTAIDSNMNVIIPDFFKYLGTKTGFIRNLWRNSCVACCMCFRRRWLDVALPFPNTMPIYQDGWICALIELKGKIIVNSEICMYFRRHDSNASPTAGSSPFSISQKIWNRLLLLFLVVRRLYCTGK